MEGPFKRQKGGAIMSPILQRAYVMFGYGAKCVRTWLKARVECYTLDRHYYDEYFDAYNTDRITEKQFKALVYKNVQASVDASMSCAHVPFNRSWIQFTTSEERKTFVWILMALQNPLGRDLCFRVFWLTLCDCIPRPVVTFDCAKGEKALRNACYISKK